MFVRYMCASYHISNSATVLFPVAQANELVIGWSRQSVMSVWVGSVERRLNASNGDDLFLGWHKHCFTWKRNGSIKVQCNCVKIYQT